MVALEAEPLEAVMGPELGGRRSAAHHEPRGPLPDEDPRSGPGRGRGGVHRRRVEHPGCAESVGVGFHPGAAPHHPPVRRGRAGCRRRCVGRQPAAEQRPGDPGGGRRARFPTVTKRIRIEHWVVAERQGQVAADIILGADTVYADVPFFWSVHFDVRIRFVGYAGGHDERNHRWRSGSDGAVSSAARARSWRWRPWAGTASPSKRNLPLKRATRSRWSAWPLDESGRERLPETNSVGGPRRARTLS